MFLLMVTFLQLDLSAIIFRKSGPTDDLVEECCFHKQRQLSGEDAKDSDANIDEFQTNLCCQVFSGLQRWFTFGLRSRSGGGISKRWLIARIVPPCALHSILPCAVLQPLLPMFSSMACNLLQVWSNQSHCTYSEYC